MTYYVEYGTSNRIHKMTNAQDIRNLIDSLPEGTWWSVETKMHQGIVQNLGNGVKYFEMMRCPKALQGIQ